MSLVFYQRMNSLFLFHLICSFSLVYQEPYQHFQELTVIGIDLKRVTPLVDPFITESKSCFLSDLDFYSRKDLPQQHTRKKIKGTQDESILKGDTLIISYENGTYENLSLSCLSFELYDPVGLEEDSVVQIITCQEESTVLVLKTKDGGGYSVEERTASQHDPSSSAAIVTRDGTSTAIYILPDNTLFHHSLAIGGLETFFIFSKPSVDCSHWDVKSYSDASVALHCTSTGQVFLVTGSNGNVAEVQATLVNPSSLVNVRNKGMAIETTDSGVRIHRNNFVDLSLVMISSAVQKVEYFFLNSTLFFLFVTSDGIVYLLNSSDPLNSDSLQTIVNEGSPIEFNSTYIFTSSSFNSLAYTMVVEENLWAVKVVDIETFNPYPAINQQWDPLLLDIRVEASTPADSTKLTNSIQSTTTNIASSAATTSTTTTTTATTTTTTTTATTTTTTTTTVLSSTEVATNISSRTNTATALPSNVSSNESQSNGVIVGVIVVAIFLIAVILSILSYLACQKANRKNDYCSFIPYLPSSAQSSNTSSEADVELQEVTPTQESTANPQETSSQAANMNGLDRLAC